MPPARLFEVLREHWKSVLTAAGVVAAVGGFTGMLYGFVPAYLVQTLHYSPSATAQAMIAALLVSSAGLIAAGWAGDYLPRHLVLRVGAALMVVTIVPIWSAIASGGGRLVLLLGALSLVFSIVSGVWPSIVATLFPTRVRFSGIALSYNLSVTILSGFAPLAASAMIERTGMLAAPAVYIAACAVLTLISSFAVGRVGRRSRMAPQPVFGETRCRSAGTRRSSRSGRTRLSEAAAGENAEHASRQTKGVKRKAHEDHPDLRRHRQPHPPRSERRICRSRPVKSRRPVWTPPPRAPRSSTFTSAIRTGGRRWSSRTIARSFG